MNATFRFMLTGALAVAAGFAGLLGQVVRIPAALWVGAAGLALVWAPLAFPPLRSMRGLPESQHLGPPCGGRMAYAAFTLVEAHYDAIAGSAVGSSAGRTATSSST